VAEAIAICKEYTSDYGRDTIISDAIDAVCAAAEKAEAELAALKRGEFICQKCGLRKDSDAPKGDF
jgi:hypothetical protein